MSIQLIVNCTGMKLIERDCNQIFFKKNFECKFLFEGSVDAIFHMEKPNDKIQAKGWTDYVFANN